MGQNRRYAHLFDELGRRRMEEAVMRPQPIGLTGAELDFEHHPVRRGSGPIPVRAWVHYPAIAVDVRAEAIEWTDRAVRVRWMTLGGYKQDVWVWANAVRRIEPGPDGRIDVRDRDLSAYVRVVARPAELGVDEQ